MGLGRIDALGIFIKNNKAVVSSLDIARVFEKEHKNVIRNIKRLGCSDEFSRLHFEPSEYLDERGKMQPAYNMTRDGAVLLIMGYTGKLAMQFKEAYIKRFSEMEDMLNLISAVRMSALMPNPERERNKLNSNYRRPWEDGECPMQLAPYVFGYDKPANFKKVLKIIGGVETRPIQGSRMFKDVITVNGMKRLEAVFGAIEDEQN